MIEAIHRVRRDAEVLVVQEGISLVQAITKILDEDVPGYGSLITSIVSDENTMLSFKVSLMVNRLI